MTIVSQTNDTRRAWLSVWVVVHFFILAICLIQNNGSSYLVRRLQQLFSPYAVAIGQDYGARPLEMTTDTERSRLHLLQYHLRDAAPDTWNTVEPSDLPFVSKLDPRWRNFQHLLALAATENNEELIYFVFDHIAQRTHAQQMSIDGVRLMRKATLSFAQNELYREGQLPAEDLNDQVLFEVRVIAMTAGQIRLLPVLERTRRAASAEKSP